MENCIKQHITNCLILAHYHAVLGQASAHKSLRDYHQGRGAAWLACADLPPAQAKIVLSLSERFTGFGAVREKLVVALRARSSE